VGQALLATHRSGTISFVQYGTNWTNLFTLLSLLTGSSETCGPIVVACVVVHVVGPIESICSTSSGFFLFFLLLFLLFLLLFVLLLVFLGAEA
jgi:hypothetical protein